MADSHQEITQNTASPETNEGDSNDVEEADEVLDIPLFVFSVLLFFFISLKLQFETNTSLLISSLSLEFPVELNIKLNSLPIQ